MQRWSLRVDPPWSLDAWRIAARQALLQDIAPAQLDWLQGVGGTLLDAPALPIDDEHPGRLPRVPKDFLELAATVLCHRDRQRMPLLYRMLWRISKGERGLLLDPLDPDMLRATRMAQDVRRDSHKMKAFVRFREVPGHVDAFIAWFEPQHHIVDRVAPFFARRFTGMRWAILTPTRSAHWDGSDLRFGDGGTQADAPAADACEDLWRTYYNHIFNPARLNTRMMQQEMPTRYWKHLPEAHVLPSLIRDAANRVQQMHDRPAQPPRRRIPAPRPEAPGTGAAQYPDAEARTGAPSRKSD